MYIAAQCQGFTTRGRKLFLKQMFCFEKHLSDDEFLIFQALQQQSSLKVQDIGK
jgi:hypothetical protein